MGVPQWLAQRLIDAGHWDIFGISRNARGRRCRDCNEWVLAGLDADRCAGTAYVDPEPLSALGEMVALMGGRSTYLLRRDTSSFRLDYRDRWAIQGNPAGSHKQRGDVVADHLCHDPGPTGPLTTESVLHRRMEAIDYAGPPPY